MHNILALRYPVRVLKCLPLHPIQNRSRYAYRDIRFCTDSTVPPSEAVQANTRQVQRQDQDLLKPLKETAKPDDGQLYFDFNFD